MAVNFVLSQSVYKLTLPQTFCLLVIKKENLITETRDNEDAGVNLFSNWTPVTTFRHDTW